MDAFTIINSKMLLSKKLRNLVFALYKKLRANPYIFNISTTDTKFSNWNGFYEIINNYESENYDNINTIILVHYSSGLIKRFYPTSIQHYPNGNTFISLNAKAGSCELKISPDGEFTITGTKLW